MDAWVEKIEKERKAQGFSKKKLAELSSLSPPALSAWVSGTRNPSALSKERVEKALGLREPAEIDPDFVLQKSIYSHPRLSQVDVDDIMALVNVKLSRR